MKPLYTEEEFKNANGNDLLPVECLMCGKKFMKLKRVILRITRKYKGNDNNTGDFCSRTCNMKNRSINANTITIQCKQCGTIVIRKQSHLKQIKNAFCTRSCAATYNNTHKKTGTRRSKLEVWLEEKLLVSFPELEIKYCDKTAIHSELDIYVPSLKLAFELNGIYHHEPIHGSNKLTQVQNNDNRKFQACLEHDIELVIMDVSSLKYFKEQNCKKYLDIITNIISNKKSPSTSEVPCL